MRSALLLPLVVLGAGCAGLQKENHLREVAGAYVYQRPLREVLPHVRALLISQGYVPIETPDPAQVDTEWREDASGGSSAGSWSRYRVFGKELGGRSLVRILKNTRGGQPPTVLTDRIPGETPTTDKEVDMGDTTGKRRGEETTPQLDYEARPSEETHPESLRATNAKVAREDKATGIRDLAMEWLLLQRADPDAAKQIYAEAEAKFR